MCLQDGVRIWLCDCNTMCGYGDVGRCNTMRCLTHRCQAHRSSTCAIMLRECCPPPTHPIPSHLPSPSPAPSSRSTDLNVKINDFDDWTTIGNTNFARPQQPDCGCSSICGYGCVIAAPCADRAVCAIASLGSGNAVYVVARRCAEKAVRLQHGVRIWLCM